MLAVLHHFLHSLAEAGRFALAVWREARALEHEAEERYGPLGF